jgi:DNA-binding protein H-NS
MIDLSTLSISELKSLKNDIDKAIKTYEDRNRNKALIAMEKAAQEFGFSMDDVLKSKKTKKAAPKYMNPANPSQTWTGRGRQPQWVKNALDQGKTMSDLAI